MSDPLCLEMEFIRFLIKIKPTEVDDFSRFDLLNWEKLFHLASDHGLFPFVFNRLTSAKKISIPASHVDFFKKRFLTQMVHNAYLYQENLRIITFLSAQGIEVIPFKGPVLALQAYGDVNWRSFSDLDFFIQAKDIDRIHHHLLSLDYNPELPCWVKIISYIKRTRRDFTFNSPDCRLDFHQQINRGPKYFQLLPDLNHYQIPWMVNGITINILRVEINLMILLIHACRHNWDTLRLIVDIAFFVQANPQIDWDVLSEASKKKNCLNIVQIGLQLAEDFCQISLPSWLNKAIEANRKCQRMVRRIKKQLFCERKMPHHFVQFMAIPVNLDNWWSRIQYVFYFFLYPSPSGWHCRSKKDMGSFFSILGYRFYKASQLVFSLLKKIIVRKK